jgi:glycosyltransferase involved in cell wall biosynthesis
VVSSEGRHDDVHDESLLKEVPERTVIRWPKSDVPWQSSVCNWFSHRSLIWRLSKPLSALQFFPDDKNPWASRAYRCGLDIVREGNVDLIYTTSHPFASHMVGLWLKRKTQLPWVADFRDPWFDGPGHTAGLPTSVVKRHLLIERTIATTADHLTFAHPLTAKSFQERHSLPDQKISCITNGFDPEDLDGHVFLRGGRDKIQVVHLGSFYGPYSPAPLKRALVLASKARPDLLKMIKLIFVGGTSVSFNDIPGLEVEVVGRLSHKEAISWLKQADIVLNIYESAVGKHHISGKFFEYLASGLPILGIVPEEGTTAEILRACRAGIVADPDDPGQILTGIERCMDIVKGRVTFNPNQEEIQKFNRYRLTEKLAGIFSELVPV